MLPSTGLFKSFACPYYDGKIKTSSSPGISTGAATCQRPYCHFKHVRKDETENLAAAIPAPVPEYTPAPKLLTLQSLTTLPQRKKKKLEYMPEKPELNASSSKRHSSTDDSQTPVYIPAPTGSNGVSNIELLNLDECEEELDELSEIIDNQLMAVDDNSKENTEEPQILAEEPIKNFDDVIIKENHTIDVKEKTETKGDVKKPSSRNNHHREDRRDSTASTSSSSKHKYKSSSRDLPENISQVRKSSKNEEEKKREQRKEKYKEKDQDKEKNQDKEKEREKRERDRDKEKQRTLKETDKEHRKDKKSSSSTSTSTSSSSSSKHKSSSSSSSKNLDKDKQHRSSSSSSNVSSKHTKSSSSTTSYKIPHKTSASTSTSRHKSSSNTSTPKKEKDTSESFEFDNGTAELFATTQEDIMKECEMIYDQLEHEFATIHKAEPNELKRKPSIGDNDDEDDSAAAATQKKRVAYENADRMKSHAPAAPRKPNHMQNAMQAVFQRQSVLRRKQEEDAAAAVADLREAEEKVREANEALRKAKEKNLTPLIAKSFLTPPIRPRTITPVANIIALERAKKKVEELRAEKKPAFTPSQTTKGSGRVAHKATTALQAVEPEKKPKPPVLEATSTKISFNIRMQYYEMMVKHCLTMYPNVADAWERAQTEELAAFKKCNTPVIYKSSALLAINKLRKEAADSGNKPAEANKLISHEVILAGKLARNTSWSVQKKIKTDATVGGEPFDKLPGDKAYDMVYDLRLTDEQLVSNGFPRAGKRIGTAIVVSMKPMRRPNETERYCSRCGKVFNMAMYDEVCVDECNYHPKSTGYRRGFADNQHRCCQQPAGTPGCTYGNYHVTDYVDIDNLTGYVTTIEKDEDYVSTKKDIYALDCEMCYTTHGIELTRVTVVDINARTVYDALVKPDNKIIDYNTIYSGITEEMMSQETRTLRDVQAILMSMFHSNTVLVGHSLDSDLKALKLIHSVVVDTSVLFPHKMGPPKKRALKTLCIENLKRIIQENEAGHDSAEDAEVCIQLVKFYLRNKIS